MMRKIKKSNKVILLSALSALAFGGIAAGTTYALFTSTAETTVSVSTGKVNVEQKVEVKECYRPTLINTDGTINDPTDAYDAETDFQAAIDGDDVTVTNMVPGDKLTLTITPTNKSNVKIKYRETYKLTGGNESLSVTAGTGMVKKWTELSAEGKISSYEVIIEIPSTATKGVDNAKITLGIEAVQGNALVYDDVYADTLEDAFNLTAGTFSYNSPNSSELSLDGKGRTYINKWIDGYITADTTIKNVTFLNGAVFGMRKDGVTVTLEGCTFYACDQSKLTYTTSNSLTNSGAGMCLNLEKMSAKNVSYVLKDCKFIGENNEELTVYGNKYNTDGTVADAFKKRGHAIALDAIAGSGGDDTYGGTLKTVLIDNCEISGVRGNAIQLYGYTGEITIQNTKINSWGINSGKYYSTTEKKDKDGNSAAIRGDYKADGSRKLTLTNVYFGLDEGTADSVNGNSLTHVNVGAYGGNTSTDDKGTRLKGTYSYPDAA